LLLPDQIHINRIRERLWCGRDIGQASVMIGSGFSRNAVKVFPTAPPFPLWNDLVGELQTRLGSKNSDVIRLGSEYEVVFGRQSLDDLLLSLIPDLQYQPDKLHKLLLSLPWSDVFTTNYDTLLERTTPFIYDRKYDTVLTHSDLPGRMKPRIVKLHGSFPSHRPFIFTEEDYRSYPKKFAPFVNTVQQSIMENIFCLIGFSGDDPNFLNWIGWVRDNLGDSTPPIYLCGLLNLSASQKQLLATKNIITIDLSPIFTTTEYPDRNIRHARAIEWFLLNLMQGEPANRLDWPEPPVTKDLKKWNPSTDLPSFPKIKIVSSTWENSHSSNLNYESLDTNDISKIIENWRMCREAYPGFVICPHSSRNQIWLYTDSWVIELIRSQALENLQKSTPIDCLSILYEIIWRFEKCLTPLYYEISKIIENTLVAINPFPKKIKIENEKGSLVTPESKEKIDWSEIRQQWVTLAFVIIKEARRDREQEKFDMWIARVAKIVDSDLDWHSRWFHEQCLFELVSLNKSKLISLLHDWQHLNLSSMWQVKLSGILFEIGECLKAEEIARQALADIRSRLRSYVVDYSLLSQEGVAMMMVETIEQSNNYEKFYERLLDRDNQDRWDTLQRYKCNPRIELERLQNICQGDLPQPKPRKEVKESFDPGYFHTSCRSTEDYITLSDLRPGFELLMMREEIGISPIMFKSSIPKAVQWIECYYPLWAIEVLMRCQNEEGIKEYFDHIAIENLETSNIESIYNWLLSRMDNSMKRMKANKYSENYQDQAWISFGTSLEVLSRMLSRIQDEQVTQIFKIIIGCISDYQDRQLVQIRSTIRSFWQRFFERLSNIDILNIMKDLLEIPLPSYHIFNEGNHTYLEPFIKIKWKNNFLLPERFDRSSWDIEISKLITNVSHADDITREYSLLRLSELISINALDEQEQKNLASALWSKLDEITGLPLIGSHCLKKSDLLYFPELEANKGKAVDLIRQHILSTEFPSLSFNSQITGKIISNLDLLINASSHLLVQSDCITKHGIVWTRVDLNALANKIFQFAINSIEVLDLKEDYTSLFDNNLRKIQSRIVSFLTLLILPSWKNLDDNSKEIVLSLSSNIIKSWGSQSQTLISLVQIEDLDKERLSRELKNKIYSSSLDLIEEGVKGIYNWLIYYNSSIEVPEPPRELIDSTISLFVSRRHPGFALYLELILSLITAIPDLLDTNQLAQILSGVEYILAETTLTKRGKRDKYIITNQKCRLYRGLAYDIAYQLDLIYSIKFPDFYPSIITQWKENSINEIWPEIKSLWKQN
jgi:SIR2-like domain